MFLPNITMVRDSAVRGQQYVEVSAPSSRFTNEGDVYFSMYVDSDGIARDVMVHTATFGLRIERTSH